jgi:hypothetical protein
MRSTQQRQQPTDMWADERDNPWLLGLYAVGLVATLALSEIFPMGWIR